MEEVIREKDKGVSAIVGTILIVAITVVLAATVYGVLTGFGGLIGASVPNASMTVTSSASSDTVSFNSVSANLSLAHLQLRLSNGSGGVIATIPYSAWDGLTITPATNGYVVTISTNTGGYLTINTVLTITAQGTASLSSIVTVTLISTSPSGTVATSTVS